MCLLYTSHITSPSNILSIFLEYHTETDMNIQIDYKDNDTTPPLTLHTHTQYACTDHPYDKLCLLHIHPPLYKYASQKYIVTLCSGNKTKQRFFIHSATSHSISSPFPDLPCFHATLSSFHPHTSTTHILIITDRPSSGHTQ